MVNRKKIVFPFYNTYFTATSIIIYQANILRTLQYLPDGQKPEIIVWYKPGSPLQELKDVGYPYISYYNVKTIGFRIKKLLSLFAVKLGMKKLFNFNAAYDIIYPADQDPFADTIRKKIYWKADFQENYYPENFLKEELEWVAAFFNHLQSHPQYPLVLSSKACEKDLRSFYPKLRNEVLLYRFVSHVPELDEFRVPELIKQFELQKPYFIVCNQFWPHKNHIAVIKALKAIKSGGTLPFQMVFTGKTTSRRGTDYFSELKNAISDADLTEDIIITDFIERTDQLLLMKNSIAVVQPTLFEGWSTVIEDARAIGKYVIASSLEVNQEQISDNAIFFEPHDAQRLAELLLSHFQNPPAWIPYDYKTFIASATQDLVRIFELS